jgi:putative phosphoesterase
MLKIGLLSDTHSWIDDRILHHLHGCDEIWHAGDIGSLKVTESLSKIAPLKAVYGNIDDHQVRLTFPESLNWNSQGFNILLIHIAGPFGKYTEQTRLLIKDFKPDLLVCGHSHILKFAPDQRNQLTYINPGAAGKHGFHPIRTMLKFTLDNGKIKDASVIELGKRNQI